MIENSPLYLMAAYGRRDTTKEAALSAWKNGKDFKVVGGPYCSIRDFEDLKKTSPKGIFIEYGRACDHAVRIY